MIWGGVSGTYLGKSGVAIFFEISGFILFEKYYYGTEKKQLPYIRFVLKRLLRLYIPLLFTLGIGVAVGWISIWNMVRQVFMMIGYSHLWILPIEVLFYTMFPLLVSVVRRVGEEKGKVIIMMVIIFSWACYICAPEKVGTNVLSMQIILLGIFVSMIYHDENKEKNLRRFFVQNYSVWYLLLFAIIGFESFGVLAYTFIGTEGSLISVLMLKYNEIFRFIIGPCIFVAAFCAILESQSVQRKLSKMNFLIRFGEISYSFYLIHYIILKRCVTVMRYYQLPQWAVVVLMFATSYVAAEIMHLTLERLAAVLAKKL